MKNHLKKTTTNSQPQKAYKTPTLHEYGSIRELTTGGSGDKREGHPVRSGTNYP